MKGTCPVGSYGSNGLGLSDMVGNVWEWPEDRVEGHCVLRGGGWFGPAENLRPGVRIRRTTASRSLDGGFRVSRTLEKVFESSDDNGRAARPRSAAVRRR